MKERTIIFPFDDEKTIARKICEIENIIGANNINDDGLNNSIPEITIRCSKKQWKEIQFICDLWKVYW